MSLLPQIFITSQEVNISTSACSYSSTCVVTVLLSLCSSEWHVCPHVGYLGRSQWCCTYSSLCWSKSSPAGWGEM